MAVYSTHNKYVSIPDWFTSLKKDASEKTAVSTAKLTVVVGGSSSGVSSGTGVSEINLYNKFVLTEVSLDKEALVNENVAIIAVKSEINNVGDLLTANGWYTTEYISIAANSLMTITTSVHDNYGLVFYDNTKTVISGTVFTQSPQDVQVPKNAVYYRISSNDVESFSILYFIENVYSSELLEQSNSNIEDYLYLDASIPEGCNTVTFTDDSFNLLVQKPLLLTKDKNNIIKLSLPQSIDGVWELKTHEETLEPYIFTKYPVVTQYGVTMYADLNKLNLPDIYAGLPVDGTIVRNEDGVFGIPIDNTTIVLDNGKLTVVGGTGGDVATEVAWANVKGKPSWLTDDIIQYTEVEGLAEKLTEYVTFDEDEQIEGVKDFLNGIKINGLSITNSQEDVIYIDSNLVVRGGITMYADNTVDVPSLMESIATDGTTIMNDGTKLYLNPNLELGGNGISSLVIKVGSESYTGTGTKDVTVTLPDFVEISDLLNYVTKSDLENYASEKYVTIAGNEDVTGVHSFVNGLKVGSSLINQLLDDVVYIDGHLAVKGGITMYVDNGTIDLPNLYDGFPTDGTIIKNDDGSFGIPIDNSTIVLSNGKLTVVGGTGGSGTVTEIAWSDVKGKPSWLNDDKISYSEVEGLTDQLTKYIPISGYTEVTGEKNFTGGLFVNDSLIVYDKDNKYWKLDGDLLVTGAITMFANEGEYTPSTIMDAVNVDGTTIMNDGTKLYINPNLDLGGGLDDVNVTGTGNAITSASLSNNILTLTKGATFLDQLSGDSRYLLTSEYKGDYTAWGQTYWNKGKPASVKGDLANVGNIKFETTGKNIGEWGKGAELTFSNAVISKGPGQSLWLVGSSYLDTNGVVFGRNDEGSRSEEIARINSIGLYPYNSNSLTLGTSSKLWKHVYTSEVTVDDINIKKSASGILYIDANLVVKGGVTMYATDATSSPSIIDSLPIANASGTKGIATFDATYFKVTDGKVTLVDDIALDEYITSLGTNGNYLTYIKNGETNNITVPYATKATQDGNGNTIAATYLKLSGGTVTGNVVMNGGSATSSLIIRRSPSVITFQNSSGTTLGYLGFSAKDVPCMYTSGSVVRTLLHSGNYNDYAPKLDGTGASGTWGISISGNASTATNALNLYNNSTGDKLGLGTSQPYFFDASALNGEGATYNLLHRGWISTSTFGNNYLDIMIQYTINTTSLSTSNYYPIVFASTPKMMRVSMYSQTGSSSAAYNCNSLDFSFRGQGWSDVPRDLTVHHYNTYAESEKTIGCIGMGQEGGMKVVWVRGGLTYYISSNVTPVLCSSNYTNGNEIYTVGTNEYGGTNTKVTILWTPQSTSSRGTMYHSGGLALSGGLSISGNLSVAGTSTFTGLATFNGNLTASASTVNNSISGSYQFRNSYGRLLSSAGWYRFATSSIANNSGGTYIFFIRRTYYNTNNEAYIISCTVDYGKVHWCILNGHANTRLITLVRCTYTNNGTMYFDLYYNGTVQNDVHVNSIGDCTLQKPTATTSTLTTTSTFSLTDGIKLGTTSAYPITVFRNATSGGAYIMYGANGQLTKSWAVGSDTSHNFAWYYKDTSAGTDICKMTLTSTGVLSSDYWMLNNTVTNPYLKLTHTYNNTTYTHYLQGYQGYLYLGAGHSKSLRIDGSGNCLAVGGITMYSDIRKKTKLKDVELTLKQVAEAPLIEHYYNSDEKKTTHVGSIAQYWVGLNDWFCKKDSDGYYTMEIQNVALASAISVARELSRFESDTDRRIRLLEEENKRLKEEIEQLKMV